MEKAQIKEQLKSVLRAVFDNTDLTAKNDEEQSKMEAKNGFITIDGGTENERVIWVPFNVLSEKARQRIDEIAKNYKEGDATKYDFSHTRIKPTEEQINYIKNTVEEIQKTYKFKGIAQIEISSELNKGSLGVCACPENCSVVSLSPQLYNGKHDQSRWERGVESGFHPKGTGEMIKSVLVHELGHAITCNSKNNKFWGEIEKIRSDYMKEVKKKDTKHPDFISGYARTNKYEFVAEAFCQGMLAKKYGKYTQKVMDSINKHFKTEYQGNLFDAKNEENATEEYWVEEYGLGYPIDEEALTQFENKQNADNKATNSITEFLEKGVKMEQFIETFKNIFAAGYSAANEAKEKEEEKAENKCKNEEVDKRKLIDEVAGMMKSAGCSDEIIRTAIKDMEKESYDKSEAGTADNSKAKNEEEKADDKKADKEDKKADNAEEEKKEEEYKELKEKTEEEAMNKAKNEIFGEASANKSSYISREERIELGMKY